jgi:hypothetical protein
VDELSFNVNEVIEILIEGLYSGTGVESGEPSELGHSEAVTHYCVAFPSMQEQGQGLMRWPSG